MRRLVKSFTWALLAATVTFSVAFALMASTWVNDPAETAGALVVIGRTLKFILYIPHDWAYDRWWPHER